MKTEALTVSTEKLNGRFYTPEFIVNNVLDLSSYHGQTILRKHAIDNSCGDGAFLVAIVNRYCREFLKISSDLTELSNELSNYIHGIEIDEIESKKCIENLNSTVRQYGLNNVKWDINCADTLTVDKYNGKMDFVLGNPPYVRVHNLGSSFDNIKRFAFAQNGMTDLYIIFYEIGLKMLNKDGILGYITPSSFFNSLAGKYMRLHLINNNLLDKIVDLKHFQAFTATTYTTITVLKNNRQQTTTEYYQFEDKNNFPYYVDTLSVEDYYICDNFYFADKRKLDELKNILTFNSAKDYFAVKNGFATLADSFFIGNFDFDEFTIPIVKASTGKQYKCIFPYSQGKLVSFEDLTANSSIKTYFETYKDILLNRSLEKNSDWYGFGRTQGINDVYRCKYSINALLKTQADLKLIKCNKGVGVYSGLYILTEVPEIELREMLYSEDFISYISLLGKYKSGGYYTFSSKDLKNYLEYKYSQRNGFENEQFSIFSYT
ncbi:MAG: N-6 DNA methylase [Muribaculaceae bacterium]|nr:N-6 DNA methylase [Muribaculaceae bacterium]